jgi:hypothetical protein
VESFAAPLERRKSSTSKLVSTPSLASRLKKKKKLRILEIYRNPIEKNKKQDDPVKE